MVHDEMQVDNILFTGIGAPRPSVTGMAAALAVVNGGQARRPSWPRGHGLTTVDSAQWEVRDSHDAFVRSFVMSELNADDWGVVATIAKINK